MAGFEVGKRYQFYVPNGWWHATVKKATNKTLTVEFDREFIRKLYGTFFNDEKTERLATVTLRLETTKDQVFAENKSKGIWGVANV